MAAAAEDSKWEEDEEIMRCCLMRLLCKHKKGTKGYDLVPSKVGHNSQQKKDKDNSNLEGFGRDDAYPLTAVLY